MADGGAAPPPLGDVSVSEAALKAQFRPGLRLLVSFETDPGWHHERVLLAPVIDDDWMVLTPDDDRYAESFGDWKSVDILTGKDSYPTSATGGLVQFGEPLDDEELVRLAVAARETASRERALRPGRIYPASHALGLSWDGGVMAIPPPAWQDRLLRRVKGKQKAPRRVPAKSKAPGGCDLPAGHLRRSRASTVWRRRRET